MDAGMDPTTTGTANATTSPAVKGAGINSLIRMLRQMSDPARFAEFERHLPPHTAALITRPRLPQEWIPLQDAAGLYAAAVTHLFDGDMSRLFDVGRQQLRNDLSTIYRVFMRVASPAFVASRASALYEVYGRDAGTLRVGARTDTTLEFILANRPFPSPAYFEAMRGAIAGTLELTGVRDVSVTIVDERGPDHRVYLAKWR